MQDFNRLLLNINIMFVHIILKGAVLYQSARGRVRRSWFNHFAPDFGKLEKFKLPLWLNERKEKIIVICVFVYYGLVNMPCRAVMTAGIHLVHS